MSKREVIANSNKQQQKKPNTNQIALVWSSIQAHWHEKKKAAIVANYTWDKSEKICTSLYKQHRVHKEVAQLTRTRQTKPKEPHSQTV